MRAIDRDKVLARFWKKVNKTETCWLWTAGTVRSSNLRYGRFHVGGRAPLAHRFAYEVCVGLIPDGLTIDHVKARGCTSTLCVNPAHLEAVTQHENVMRGEAPSADNATKTHCPAGHEYTSENTYVWRGGRDCRACTRDRGRRRRARRRAAAES